MTTTTRLAVGACAATALALALSARGLTSGRDRFADAHTATTQAAPAAAPKSSAPAITLSPNIPGEVAFGGGAPGATLLQQLQEDFDIFSWNSFIALNWPPAANGNGDPSKKIGATGDNPTVWERYQGSSDIFLPGGQPPEWGRRASLPKACQAFAAPGIRVLTQIDKTASVLEESLQPFDTGPLIDQARRFARFEILTNRVMFDYVVNNKLYSKAGQKAFNADANFPCGTPSAEGAIMVKAAWKVIQPGTDSSRFHTSRVLVYTPAIEVPKTPEACSVATVGLVGFHIGHKTTSAAQWVWSTFEHEDNAPTESQVKSGQLKAAYNYYNPKCKECPVNTAAPRPWVPTRGGPPTQVVRADVLPQFATDSATARNADAKKLLAGVNPKSVWQHYELISTQWPTNTGQCAILPADPEGTPAPPLLANTTLETFIQGTVTNVHSSCITCHNNATMTSGKASDFTYLLQRAR